MHLPESDVTGRHTQTPQIEDRRDRFECGHQTNNDGSTGLCLDNNLVLGKAPTGSLS